MQTSDMRCSVMKNERETSSSWCGCMAGVWYISAIHTVCRSRVLADLSKL